MIRFPLAKGSRVGQERELRISLGYHEVHNRVLPRWARGCIAEYVRTALLSDFCIECGGDMRNLVLLKDRNQLIRQPYAVSKPPGPIEELCWRREKNVELIEEELSDFLAELAEDMEVKTDA